MQHFGLKRLFIIYLSKNAFSRLIVLFQETTAALRSGLEQAQRQHTAEIQTLSLSHESARNDLQQKLQHVQARNNALMLHPGFFFFVCVCVFVFVFVFAFAFAFAFAFVFFFSFAFVFVF